MKIPILGTGLSGLVGSRVVELLSDEFDFEDLSFDTGIDVTNRDQVFRKIKESKAEWILHLAAKTDVDACEKDKLLGKEGPAWKINVEGTRNIVEAAEKTNKRVLYISTDFVFSGNNEFNIEEDTPAPVNWYGVTKYEGEKLVLSNSKNIVARITYPYRAKNPVKRDFVHNVLDKLQKNQTVTMLTDHYFTPTFIDDISEAVKMLIVKQLSGVYHLVGDSSLSPFEGAILITKEFECEEKLIEKTTISEYFKNRAPRPYNLRTKNAKITSLGVKMHSFVEGLQEIKKQGIL